MFSNDKQGGITLTSAKKAKNGVHSKGKNRINDILDAAHELLINEGYHNFSMRKVADAAGIKLGNLQYYFPSKSILVSAMLDKAIQVYLDEFDEIRTHGDPEEQFQSLIKHVINDLTRRETTSFFPELWSLCNHEEEMTVHMDQMYAKYRSTLADIITEMNSALSPKQAEKLALFISASIEGHTVFIGHNKPWKKEVKNIIKMAFQSFTWLIQNGDIPKR